MHTKFGRQMSRISLIRQLRTFKNESILVVSHKSNPEKKCISKLNDKLN